MGYNTHDWQSEDYDNIQVSVRTTYHLSLIAAIPTISNQFEFTLRKCSHFTLDGSQAQFRRRSCVESNLTIKLSIKMHHKCGKYLFVGSDRFG